MLLILSTCFSATVVWQPALTTINSGAESVCSKSYTSKNTYPVCTQAFHDCSTTRIFVLSIAELPAHSRCAFRSLFSAVLFFAGSRSCQTTLQSCATWLALGSALRATCTQSQACERQQLASRCSQLRNLGQKNTVMVEESV